MERKNFQKLCKEIFKRNGFIIRGNNFYFETDNLFLVYGLQHSNFGRYYYIEHGIADKTINKYLPWPKYYQVNRGRSRIDFELIASGDTQALFYDSEFDKEQFISLLESSIQSEKNNL